MGSKCESGREGRREREREEGERRIVRHKEGWRGGGAVETGEVAGSGLV